MKVFVKKLDGLGIALEPVELDDMGIQIVIGRKKFDISENSKGLEICAVDGMLTIRPKVSNVITVGVEKIS